MPAVKGTEQLVPATQGSVRAIAVQLAAGVPAEEWVACSAGQGAKGRRLYDWTRIPLAAPAAAGCTGVAAGAPRPRPGAGLLRLLRPGRNLLLGLVRVAGTRWTVEENFQAKTEVGLDPHQLRRWPGWYRHTTLALLAHALLAVPRATATASDGATGAAAA